jgi:hypothetical protein
LSQLGECLRRQLSISPISSRNRARVTATGSAFHFTNIVAKPRQNDGKPANFAHKFRFICRRPTSVLSRNCPNLLRYQSCREILPPPTCDLCFPSYSCCREIYAHDVQFRYFFFHFTRVVAEYPVSYRRL